MPSVLEQTRFYVPLGLFSVNQDDTVLLQRMTDLPSDRQYLTSNRDHQDSWITSRQSQSSWCIQMVTLCTPTTRENAKAATQRAVKRTSIFPIPKKPYGMIHHNCSRCFRERIRSGQIRSRHLLFGRDTDRPRPNTLLKHPIPSVGCSWFLVEQARV